jgi:hypothetical protein
VSRSCEGLAQLGLSCPKKTSRGGLGLSSMISCILGFSVGEGA